MLVGVLKLFLVTYYKHSEICCHLRYVELPLSRTISGCPREFEIVRFYCSRRSRGSSSSSSRHVVVIIVEVVVIVVVVVVVVVVEVVVVVSVR